MSFATLARGCNMRRLPVALRNNRIATTNKNNNTPRRFMGGGGGGGQPISQSMEAELWQGHPKTPEGWETTIYLTYGATAVLLTCALGFAPDTSIKTVSEIDD